MASAKRPLARAINRVCPPSCLDGGKLKKTYIVHLAPVTSRLPSAMSSSFSMNKYWIPHLDIHKKVITQELQYYLGPEATVRSFTRDVGCCLHPAGCGPSVDGHRAKMGS
jgi:hypothetical protein